MKLTSRIQLLVLIIASLAIILVLSSGSALGVDRVDSVIIDGYEYADVTVSPVAACVGDDTTFSGSGAFANSEVALIMISDASILGTGIGAEDVYGAFLGVTTSSADGDWSLTVPIPATVEPLLSTEVVPTFPGTWVVMALSASYPVLLPDLHSLGAGSSVVNLDEQLYLAAGTFDILDCDLADSGSGPIATRPSSSAVSPSSLPVTGAQLIKIVIVGALIVIAGFLVRKRAARV